MPTDLTGSFWSRIPSEVRQKIIWTIWFISWIGLLIGLRYPVFWKYVVWFSVIHAVIFIFLFEGRISAFPVQLRVVYVVWVGLGTYVPALIWMMYITIIGLATNLFVGYCPLARMLYLLPWNRQERFSGHLVKRVFFSPPVKGQFKPPVS